MMQCDRQSRPRALAWLNNRTNVPLFHPDSQFLLTVGKNPAALFNPLSDVQYSPLLFCRRPSSVSSCFIKPPFTLLPAKQRQNHTLFPEF